MIRISHNDINTGYSVKFENGITVSVQIGSRNYHSLRDTFNPKIPKDQTLVKDGSGDKESPDAETAIMCDLGFIIYKGEQVQGYQDAEDILETMNFAASLPPVTEDMTNLEKYSHLVKVEEDAQTYRKIMASK
jgi:hypothetical protein